MVGSQHLAAAAEKLGFPVILKHNRAGKGLGVQLILSQAALQEAVAKIAADPDPFAAPRDGVWLVQRYIEAPEPFITRAEFINGTFLYAVRVDTSEGFELCDQTHCQVFKGYYDYTSYKQAIQSTKNLVVLDSLKGDLAELLFHSNCGGQTCASEDVWKSTLTYCRSIRDTFCLGSQQAIWKKLAAVKPKPPGSRL